MNLNTRDGNDHKLKLKSQNLQLKQQHQPLNT